MGIIDENEKKNNSPSMTIALPPLVPMSMPRYRGVESIAEAKRATERLARCELERKGVRLIDANDDAKNVNVVFFFFFAAPRTPVPRLALPVQLQQQKPQKLQLSLPQRRPTLIMATRWLLSNLPAKLTILRPLCHSQFSHVVITLRCAIAIIA